VKTSVFYRLQAFENAELILAGTDSKSIHEALKALLFIIYMCI